MHIERKISAAFPGLFLALTLIACPFFGDAQNVGIGTTTPVSKLHIIPDNAAGLQLDPYGAAAGQTGEFRLLELSVNGTHYVGFKAPDNVAGSVIWVLPAADGSNGQVLTTNGAGTLSWTTPAGGGGGGTGGDSHCYTCDGF